FLHLDVEVTRWAATRADLTLTGQPHPHPVAHPGGHLGGDVAPGPDPAVPAALPAGLRNDLPEAPAHRAGPGGHHLAEERPLHVLDFPGAPADVAGPGAGAGRAARAAAFVAQHGGIDRELPGGPAGALLQGELQPDQGLGATLHPAARPAAAPGRGARAKEGVHDVAKGEPAEGITTAAASPARLQRVPAEVNDLAFLRVSQHFVGGGDLLESLLSTRVG